MDKHCCAVFGGPSRTDLRPWQPCRTAPHCAGASTSPSPCQAKNKVSSMQPFSGAELLCEFLNTASCSASAALHVLSTHAYCSHEGTPPCLQVCSTVSCGAYFKHATSLVDSRSTSELMLYEWNEVLLQLRCQRSLGMLADGMGAGEVHLRST